MEGESRSWFKTMRAKYEILRSSSMEICRFQQGVVLPLIALMAFGLILFVALVIDIGWIAHVRNQAQSAVDASALSGAAAIPHYLGNAHSRTNIEKMAMAFNGSARNSMSNIVASSSPDIRRSDITLKKFDYETGSISDPSAPGDVNAVQVTKIYRVPLFLSHLQGIPTWNISATATAVLTGPACLTPNYPLALVDCGLLPACEEGSTAANCSICRSARCAGEIKFTVAINEGSQGNTAGFWAYDSNIDQSANADLCADRVSDRSLQSTYHELCAGDAIQLLGGTVQSCLNKMELDCQADRSNDYLCANPITVNIPVFECGDISSQSYNINQDAYVNAFIKIRIDRIKNTVPRSMTFAILCNNHLPGTPGGGPFCGAWAGGANLAQ